MQCEIVHVCVLGKNESRKQTKLTVVDESCRPEPELSTAFARGIHHTKVVDARPQHSAVGGAQLSDAAQQDLHALSCEPTDQQHRGDIAAVMLALSKNHIAQHTALMDR